MKHNLVTPERFAMFFICTLISVLFLNAQDIKEKKIYTIQPGEKIIMGNEHRLLVSQNGDHYLLFVEKAGSKYIIYDEKRFGPFQEIQEWESEANLFDWAVKKEGKWYQLLLDFDKLIGPYDEVIDVYRDNSNQHFGFRARKDTNWYVIIDNKTYGPYKEMTSGYPRFSPLGNNWIFKYLAKENGKWKSFLKLKNEELDESDLNFFEFQIEINEQGYNYPKISGTSIKYHSTGWWSSGESEIQYYFKNKNSYSNNDNWEKSGGGALTTSPSINTLTRDGKETYILCTENKYLDDRNGRVAGPFNEITSFGIKNGKVYAIVKNYFVKENGKFIPVYSNYKGNDASCPEGEFKRQKNIWIGNKSYGPFDDVINYSLQIAKSGNFVCIVNSDEELYANGTLSGIKNVKNVIFDYSNGNYLAFTNDGSVWYDKNKIGNFTVENFWSDVQLSENGMNYAILCKKNNDNFIYLSTSKQSIPVKFSKGSFEWIVSDNFKHVAYNTGTISIDNKQGLDQNTFSLVYSKKLNSFCWLTLMGNEIYKKEYQLKE